MCRTRYSIVIPTLNERENIITLIQQLESLFPAETEIIVVDENSPDGTHDVVAEYGNGKESVKALLNDRDNPGLSPSIVKGFDLSRGDFLCCMDADLQHNPEFLPQMFALAESGHDLVIGSRHVEGGGFAQKWSPFRKFTSFSATLIAKLILGIQVKDPMSGFFVIRRTAYNEVRDTLNPKGWKIMLELLYTLKKSKKEYSITESGILFNNRLHGQSKLSSKVIFQYVKMLFELRFRR